MAAAAEALARLRRTVGWTLIHKADHIRLIRQILPHRTGRHGYPAVLKNAMDWTFPQWQRKPIAFVGWGNVGGARAIEQLRLVAVEFEMAPLRHAVHILPDVMLPARQAADVSDTTAFAPLEPKLKLLADDLTWWAAALAAARARKQR